MMKPNNRQKDWLKQLIKIRIPKNKRVLIEYKFYIIKNEYFSLNIKKKY